MEELRLFVISISVLVVMTAGGCMIKKIQKRRKWFLSRILMVSFWGAIFVWCYGAFFWQGEPGKEYIQDFFLSLLSSFKVFTMESDFEFFEILMKSENEMANSINAVYTSLLLAVAPVLTVSVILSFFSEVAAAVRIFCSRNKAIFVFSELNQESLSIARSCQEKAEAEKRKILIIFTDVYKNNAEHLAEMLEEAYAMDAICVKKDVLSLNYSISLKKKRVKEVYEYRETCEFFIMGKNEDENLEHTMALVRKFYSYGNVKVYLFSECRIEKILVNAMIYPDMKMKVRCINLKQNVIYNYLYHTNLFDYAKNKTLSIGIAGNGTYAKELIKGLLWYGQLPEYELQLHIFDESGSLEEEFRNECPELMERNGKIEEGEAKYRMNFYVCSPGTDDFANSLKGIKYLSALYMMYENEEKKNIRYGIESDRILKRKEKENQTKIVCLICDTVKKHILQKEISEAEKGCLRDHKGNPYNLEFLCQEYSYDYIFESEMEEEAKREHLKWSNISTREKDTEDFYNYDYFYRSSMARVIRAKLRRNMYGDSAEENNNKGVSDTKQKIRQMEHAGWNAYMRTEGYCYGQERNEMLKLHPDLVPYSKLTEKEQSKDED